MKKILLLIICSISLYSGINEKEKDDYSYFDKMELKSILKFMAEDLSKQIPVQMDSSTTLVRAFSYNNTFVYIKEVDFTKEKDLANLLENRDTKKELKVILYENDKNIVCADEFFAYLMEKKGAIVEYRWVDAFSKKIFTYTVEHKDCLK